jgi:ryanodine receptor 2
MAYQPKPIDTEHVALTEEIREITERLAENAHDRWAQQRLKDGWTYGPQRDDARKTHPGLVPYDQLPEAEKEYDRIVALQTLKAILALGYRIERSPSATSGSNPPAP